MGRAQFDSESIHVWGAAFERFERERRIPQLERIETRLTAFERWAKQVGRDLEPFFRTRRVESTFTDESFVVCRLPTLALAEYRGDDLVHVAPSCDGERRSTSSIGSNDSWPTTSTNRSSATTKIGLETASQPAADPPPETAAAGSARRRRDDADSVDRGNHYGYC